MALQPSRGEIWLADLNPIRGHEQAGKRPVVVISTDLFNHGPSGLVFVLPLTRTNRGIPFHIPIEPPEGGLRETSFILCDALRSISKERLGGRSFGKLSRETISEVENALRILMEM